MRVSISNKRHWLPASYDQLIVEATRITDQGERLRLYRQADRILIDEASLAPTVYGVRHFLIQPGVKIAEPHYPRLKDGIIEAALLTQELAEMTATTHKIRGLS